MKKLLILLSLAVVVISCRTHDGPPKTDGPAPEPHSGVFVCGADTLVFNGDGETISWSFSEQPDSLASKGSGRYWFLISGKMYRYDVADELLINDGTKSLNISLHPCATTEDTIWVTDGQGKEKIFSKITE